MFRDEPLAGRPAKTGRRGVGDAVADGGTPHCGSAPDTEKPVEGLFPVDCFFLFPIIFSDFFAVFCFPCVLVVSQTWKCR